MRTDTEIHDDIRDDLNRNAKFNSSNININVIDGHVELTGSIDSYLKKTQVEEAVRGIAGVKTVGNEIIVRIPSLHKKTDDEIKKAVKDSIIWNSTIQENKIKVEVKDSWVVLSGIVDWQYQRTKARLLAQDITGVTGVTDLIRLASASETLQATKENIVAAFEKNRLNTASIDVAVDEGKATLIGQVRTIDEKNVAEVAALSTPGVTEVVNKLEIDYADVYA